MEKSTGSSRRRLSQSPTRSHGLFHQYVQLQYFNSRLLAETNRNVKVLIHNSGISTHVSAMRRTKHTMNCSRVLIFQFMSPQGDEHKAVSLFISLLLFQLTSPRGDEPVFIGCIPFDIIISTRVSVRRRTVRIAMSA